jgi:hypothetical protein
MGDDSPYLPAVLSTTNVKRRSDLMETSKQLADLENRTKIFRGADPLAGGRGRHRVGMN